MMGASGPSISTTALSTPRPASAARTCSAVDTSGPDSSPSTVANSVAVTALMSAGISRSCWPSMRVRRIETFDPVANKVCFFEHTDEEERRWLEEHGPVCPQLLGYLR